MGVLKYLVTDFSNKEIYDAGDLSTSRNKCKMMNQKGKDCFVFRNIEVHKVRGKR